jgi:uncharacterized Fe-S cluster-containing radical SAM superfamily protein
MKIRAALTGRISRICVYCSSWRARANEDESGDHQITREVAVRMQKTSRDNDSKMDLRSGALGTM